MLDSAQTAKPRSQQYWNLFAQSGDPKMYLKYKSGQAKKAHENS